MFVLAPIWQGLAACPITVTERDQVVVHRATIIVEGTATAEQYTFDVTKFWKGSTASKVRLSGIHPTGDDCDTFQPTKPGERYFLLIQDTASKKNGSMEDYPGAAQIFPMREEKDTLREYLSLPVRVSRREVLTMLRGWRDRTVDDARFSKWLEDVTPRAEVDDWIEDMSPNLEVMSDLRWRLVHNEFSPNEMPCVRDVLRERVVPAMIRILETRRLTSELADTLNDLEDGEYDETVACTQDDEPVKAQPPE